MQLVFGARARNLRRRGCAAALALAALAGLAGCKKEALAKDSQPLPAVIGPAPTPGQLFTEITGFVGFNDKPPRYPDGTFMTVEITPGGVALFDYDNDGLLDLLTIPHPPPGPY